ncbi:hypothetical protein [Xenorhabdus lircayensis]
MLYHDKTKYRDLNTFENTELGRIMTLDGGVQTTKGDNGMLREFCYQ